MDSCNFLYVLRAMPVFGVISVNWGCGVCHGTSVFTVYVLYLLLHIPSSCFCLSSLVKPSWIRAITPTCFVLCLSSESFLSTAGRCGFHAASVFAVFYFHLQLTSASACL